MILGTMNKFGQIADFTFDAIKMSMKYNIYNNHCIDKDMPRASVCGRLYSIISNIYMQKNGQAVIF
jgi:hypothetical protein